MRCEIGVSLLHNPKVLFLDEPTLGLDIVSKNAILQLLKQINKTQKTTMILTTHEIEDISKLCERVILIERGNIAYDGETVSLCERNSYKYIQLKYTRKPECKNISGFITEEEDDGCTLSWKVPVDKLSDVMKELLEQKECIVDINVNTASLTDVIFDMYTKEKDEEDDE